MSGNRKTGSGLLIRLIDQESLEGENDSYDSHLWIGEISEIDALGLSSRQTEELRRFWYSGNEILFLESNKEVLSSGPMRILAERISERRRLFIFGAGHVGRSIALMGAMLGLEVTLIDDRHEFLEVGKLFDHSIQTLHTDFNNAGKNLLLDRHAAVVIVTRGHQFDEMILKQIAEHKPGYVGMIGSRRRVEGIFRRLRVAGVNDAFLNTVLAPIGLDIGARTPQEIAISVHAEIIKHFNLNEIAR
jgi:xanthine/CO dehydrogenase XdhC/CoxF family maturation factor